LEQKYIHQVNILALAYISVLGSTKDATLFVVHDKDQILSALVCGGFGLLLLLLVISALREAVAMKRWPVAKGRVLSSTVEEYRADAGASNFGGAHARTTLYRPVVLYEYEVAGHRYRSNRIAQSPGINRGVPTFAEKTAQRYPSGCEVDVRFNPKRPDESVLEPRVPAGWILLSLIAVALLALASHIYFGPT
jgi:hypothetical protein